MIICMKYGKQCDVITTAEPRFMSACCQADITRTSIFDPICDKIYIREDQYIKSEEENQHV